MTKTMTTAMATATILTALCGGAAAAAPPISAPKAATANEAARLAMQRSVLAEKMGQMQLDMLVSDVLDDNALRAKAEPRHELSMLTLRR